MPHVLIIQPNPLDLPRPDTHCTFAYDLSQTQGCSSHEKPAITTFSGQMIGKTKMSLF